MSEATVYGDDEVRAILADSLPAWSLEGGHLTRVYRTADFASALALANAAGFAAEAAWHHPELRVTWGALTVRLRTHEPDGITAKDVELARRIEAVATWAPAPGDALEGRPAS